MESLFKVWREFQVGNGIPRVCGNPACQQWHAPPKEQAGAADAEGLLFQIGGMEIRGEDLNICPACAEFALCGRKPFKRKGVRVVLR